MGATPIITGGTYIVFCGTGNSTCLGVQTQGSGLVCYLARFDKNADDQVWAVHPVPGTEGFYLQHYKSGAVRISARTVPSRLFN